MSLRILGRRADGFHEIKTFIAPISLRDELVIEKQNRSIDFHCDDPTIPKDGENLVVRAAKAFFDATKVQGGVSISLQKKIPHGAGLGGGSSDAASTLIALNQLFQTNLPREALAKMAEEIGSDVPFFIFESAALCKGRGELVEPANLKQRFSIVLFKPTFGVPTAWAYSNWENAKVIPGISYDGREFAGSSFVNDLERPVFEKFVFLGKLKMWLLGQPEVGVALMSGSGSTMFAIVQDSARGEVLANRARHELDRELWTCVCETMEGAALPAP